MTFNRASDWHYLSDCGRYTVALARVGSRFVFTAFLARVGKGQPTLLASFKTRKEATTCCENHEREHHHEATVA